MRNLRRPLFVKRSEDMPLYGLLTRVGKGRYEVIIKFVASKRILHKEQLRLPSKKAVQRFYLREFPTLTWGEPKFTRKGKLRKRKAKKSDKERLQRTGAATRHCQA
jgi:hypothetical protein